MKRLFFTALILPSMATAFAQTNTFPSSGNVGIGTTSPYQKLSLMDGQVYLGSTTSNAMESGRIRFSEFTGTVFQGAYIHYDGSANKLFLGVHDPYDALTSSDFRAITINRAGGYVGIGTVWPDARLTVKGQIHAQEVKVDLAGAVAPDYVFEKGYPLASLTEVKNYIDRHKHLPDMPSASQMEKDGMLLKEMNLRLLKKIEELTLYMIEQEKRTAQLEAAVEALKETNEQLQRKLE